MPVTLLGAAEVRALAADLDVTPTKKLGQNFVVDANTVRKIVHLAGVQAGEHVVEVGPGLGFLTLAILETGAEVTAVATFYSMYRREPTGTYRVGVCTNTLCAVMGGDAIMEALTDHLGIGHGETTEDGTITLEHIECNAACDYAPVMMVNWEFFDNSSPSTARALVDALRSGAQVTPTRGAPLCTFRQTERILAGFADDRPGALESSGGAGEASLVGLRYAREHAMSAPETEPNVQDEHPDLGAEAVSETVREKPAPAPSATVPPRANTAETDPLTNWI